jgi:hypothetical protein
VRDHINKFGPETSHPIGQPTELDDAELVRHFRASAHSMHPRAPLYAALDIGIAQDPALFRLLLHAPPTQRLPVLLFASTHTLLLADPSHPLAEWYPNLTEQYRSPDDPALLPTFKAFVEDNATALAELLGRRTTQTNEVGRCLMLLPAFDTIAAESGPLAHLDVGCSGGLTLLSDRYQYRYEPAKGDPVTIGPDSTVLLTAQTRGDRKLPTAIPTIAARCGIDLYPIDVTDDTEAHWLEACVWPDQRDRFLRLRAAIAIARERPPELLAGDAAESVAPAIERMAQSAHPVVTNSWALNYLTGAQRSAYVAALDRQGAVRDLSWVFVEAPALTPELPWNFETEPNDPHLTVTAMVRWRGGVRTVEHLATSHPHGFWIHFT